MKKTLAIALALASTSTWSAPRDRWVTVDNSVLEKVQPKLGKSTQKLFSGEGATVVKMSEKEIEALSHVIHHELHRCGGFMGHDSYEEAKEAITSQGDLYFAKRALFADYSITEQDIVAPLIKMVREDSIRGVINSLANFHNRFYKAQTGYQSSEFIKKTWENLSKHRTDVKVEFVQHSSWLQPSIVMTIEGAVKSDEIVVLGGHADSISGMFGQSSSRAPGADDNASGIATITEVIKVLMESDFRPERTIQFMGYAAEEVGLLGSKEIATKYKKEGKSVVGVMQLDMTLRKGTANKDIVMMSDYTNQAQNEFLGRLIDEYVKVPWGYSRCGYGCSDHASWTANGYPASIPFESTMEDINRKIHTAQDTLESAGGDASHAVKFAKLATAFVVEMAK